MGKGLPVGSPGVEGLPLGIEGLPLGIEGLPLGVEGLPAGLLGEEDGGELLGGADEGGADLQPPSTRIIVRH